MMSEGPFSYEHPRPGLTVDCVVFGLDPEADELEVLLIERELEPFAGRWALPGGFVRLSESLEEAARRELQEETGVRPSYLEQLYTFGAIDRDPRGRIVSVAWYALVKLYDHSVRAATDARQALWFRVSDRPPLAFDHDRIFELALARLRAKVRYEPIGFELLPEIFPLSALRRMYEIILERPLDKRNFRKKVLAMGLLEDTGEVQQDVAHRAARLYRFDRARYERLGASGFDFEV